MAPGMDMEMMNMDGGVGMPNSCWTESRATSGGTPPEELTTASSAASSRFGLLDVPPVHWPYMSPEQTGRLHLVSVDHRSDLYSMGVTLYECITGEPPFSKNLNQANNNPTSQSSASSASMSIAAGPSSSSSTSPSPSPSSGSHAAMDLVHAHLARAPAPIFCPTAPQPLQILEGIIMKLLSKNVDARYQSAEGVQIDLEYVRAYIRYNRGQTQTQSDSEGIPNKNIRVPDPHFHVGRVDALAVFNVQPYGTMEGNTNHTIGLQRNNSAGSSHARSNSSASHPSPSSSSVATRRVFGRSLPFDRILSKFVSLSAPQLLLVSGASGSGKTFLVEEAAAACLRMKGNGAAIRAKFDLLHAAGMAAQQRAVTVTLGVNGANTPDAASNPTQHAQPSASAVIGSNNGAGTGSGIGNSNSGTSGGDSVIFGAFQSLIKQCFTSEIKHWKAKLKAALGNHAWLLLEVLPDLSQLLGPCPPPAHMIPAHEAQRLFNVVFLRFVECFANKSHPLILMLDDLQCKRRRGGNRGFCAFGHVIYD